MKTQRWVWVLILAVALAAPAMAGEKGHKCTASTQECLNKMVQKMQQKGWVGIEYDKSKKKDGTLAVMKVVPDSPAEKAGLKKGDVLLALNGVKFGDTDEAKWKKIKSGMTPGARIRYLVARDGKKKEVQVTLGKLPESVMAEWIGRHMLEHATIEVAKK